jgi:hypothetical protein
MRQREKMRSLARRWSRSCRIALGHLPRLARPEAPGRSANSHEDRAREGCGILISEPAIIPAGALAGDNPVRRRPEERIGGWTTSP